MATILIIGASRGIGREVVKLALASRHMVRALARSVNDIATDHPLLETMSGDALNRGDVEKAVAGVDAVFQVLGVPANLQTMLGPVRLFSESTRILVQTMALAGVKRLLSVTGFGAGDSRQRLGCLPSIPFHLFLERAYSDKDVQEQLIRESALEWVIVRPVLLTNGRRTGRYQILVDEKSWRGGLISRADVAEFLVNNIAERRYLRKTVVLAY